jgi:hypothetical protein
MDRRTVLRTTGALFLGATAGCLGGGESDFDLEVVHNDFGPDEDGNLTVSVTVSNPGNERQVGTLYVTAEIGEESKVRVRDVDLQAHETTTFEIGFDERYDSITSLSVDANVEPTD